MSSTQSFYSSYITLLLRAETLARYQQSLGTTSIKGLEQSSELATRLLISVVEWARNIPFYTEFMLSDQSVLLRSCWSELFILNAAQHSSPFHLSSPLTSCALAPMSNGLFPSNGGTSGVGCDENMKIFQEQVVKLKSLHIDSAEFSCLKAIILFNPGEK